MEKILFKEEQRFTQWWLWLILVFTLLAIVVAVVNKATTQTLNTNSTGDMQLLWYGSLYVFCVTVVMIVLFLFRLKTKITDKGIFIAYPPLVRKWKKIEPGEIRKYEIRKYNVIREYGGYGIKKRKKYGRAYIISGNIGLQLYLKDGKRILIGTWKKQAIKYAMKKLMEGEE